MGGSPGGTVEAEVLRFAELAALQAAPAGSLAGKIALVVGAIMVLIGSFWIKQIAKLDV